MRGYVLSRYGESPVMRTDVDKPTQNADQILVRVTAAGLNPVDYKTRDGKVRIVVSPPLPSPMGNELSGVVEAVGANVKRFAAGDNIFARVEKKYMGAFADYAVVKEEHAAKAPSSIDLVAAAAVPLAGLTALQALRDELHVKPGMHVLITGGAGGVGTFAVQIAKKLGAKVTTTASPRGAQLCRDIGADVVIDYTKEAIGTSPASKDGYDGAFDTVGGDSLAQCFPVVKRGGVVVSVAGMPEPGTARDLKRGAGLAALFWAASFATRRKASARGLRYRYLFMRESGADLELLARFIDEGAMKPVVEKVFPFDDIAAAMLHLESGRAKGKLVLQM